MAYGIENLATITVDDDGDGVAVVWLDRPDRGNAFTFAMQGELHDALSRLDENPGCRVVVVTGRGRFFSTGADLEGGGSTFAQTEDETRALRQVMAHRTRPWNLGTMVIGALNGAAVGLGLTLTLQWDLRIMAEDAKFGFVFPRRGLTPEAGSVWLLPRLIGQAAATDLLLTGRFFDGREAERRGLASRSVPADQVLPTALEVAHDVAVHCAPTSIATTKQMLASLTPMEDLELAWSSDWEIFRWVGRQPDAAEGVRSFIEKRDPTWPGGSELPPASPSTPWEQ